ncbi:hypothetical protein TBLA_0B09500 [Henningerozyma blattae CBS 6284]|uniref:Cysteine protease RIM13 n=1 Tax=Henningerozyma blattae (strain ATCC 34711 / CBS 6284 / DSM 70876 / NBRC 10599 / NRRL Y-10934 / UCD 77-7) TaxID=1071380 RepID=I2H065_HENB6|nr:hypothetical protein TBLA_0B09500 [Tetrapisispora blattae CBS 6284]CCH59767.1 hypothetical protein TBLA_0B09500 [Tetrapisispora blattae CBS 6284]
MSNVNEKSRWDAWETLNSLRLEFYKHGKLDNAELKKIERSALKSTDASFIEGVLQLKEDMELKNGNAIRRAAWLTSKGPRNIHYFPINSKIAGPIPFYNSEVLLTMDTSLRNKYTGNQPLMNETNYPYDCVSQNGDIEDCSLVCSLINSRLHGAPLPIPVLIENTSLYNLNLHFNGSDERLITVDVSTIPTTNNLSQLSLHSKNINDKIIERAYLWLMDQSYDTIGSNTAIDTFRLTGYLPEIIKPNIFSFDDYFRFFNSKLCLMALGTNMSLSTKSKLQLKTGHDYSIIDINKSTELFIISDPLKPWNILRISYEEVLNNISQVYLNWNWQKAFLVHKAITFKYDSKVSNQFQMKTIFDKPIFKIVNKSTKNIEKIWLLLETHLKSSKLEPLSIAYLTELNELSTTLISTVLEQPINDACSIGFYLLKFEIKPNMTKKLICYSSHTDVFTLHSYSISNDIIMTRDDTIKNTKSIHFGNGQAIYTLHDPLYHTNQSYSLKITNQSEDDDFSTVFITLQLMSNILNPQIPLHIYLFHYDDYELLNPLSIETNYEFSQFNTTPLSIMTNTRYRIICSTDESYLFGTKVIYKLTCNVLSDQPKEIAMNQIFINNEAGNMPYFEEYKFPVHFQTDNYSSLKLNFFSPTNQLTNSFVRICLFENISTLRVKYHIIDTSSGKLLSNLREYGVIPIGGFVIPNLKIPINANLKLVIEIRNEDLNNVRELESRYNANAIVKVSSDRKLILRIELF